MTRSAAATSSGLALRPVTTMCRSLRRAASSAITDARSRQIEIVVTQRDIELVENDKRERRIGHQLARLRPGALGRRDVAFEILRVPGEAFAHGVPGHLIAELLQRIALGPIAMRL